MAVTFVIRMMIVNGLPVGFIRNFPLHWCIFVTVIFDDKSQFDLGNLPSCFSACQEVKYSVSLQKVNGGICFVNSFQKRPS